MTSPRGAAPPADEGAAGRGERVHEGDRRAAATWQALFRTQALLLRRLQDDPIWDDVSLREYDVLFALASAGGALRLRDLTESLYLVQSSVSRLVARMAARGLVSRSVPSDDARGTLVTITGEGRRVQREVGARHVQAIGRYVGDALDDDQQRALRALLDALRKAQPRIADIERP
ncbi:MarR family winged helix-turn-helix transcriptional regulator [Xylanimonas ulmi]|uniref:MarR family transcriptional regulator n=1 Tax=Xylanimonas ulmi TaxID=228973 RepID=A0A4Q7LZA8_9MICO|nr:MarR family winged helix-turn-helix transcriptional regulator [Xylanibacterium ulmi]RZS59883.1 MarR family transcriptional regulator [Xylanibacterium ulmi]